MARVTGLAIGVLTLGAAGLALAPPPLKAGEPRQIELLRRDGGHLGVTLKDVESSDVSRLRLQEERGAIVQEVEPDTPAQKAGLKEGDVILGYQGQKVYSVAQLTRMVRETPPGRKVALEVSREGALERISATLDERGGAWLADNLLEHFDVPMPKHAMPKHAMPKPPKMPAMPKPPEMPAMPKPPEMPGLPETPALPEAPLGGKERLLLRGFLGDRGPRKLGLDYQPISGQLAKYFGLADEQGLLVVEVQDGGPAAKAGIKAGDVILKLNGAAVRDSSGLLHELARLSAGDEATLTVQREGKPLDLKVIVGGRRPESRGRSGEQT